MGDGQRVGERGGHVAGVGVVIMEGVVAGGGGWWVRWTARYVQCTPKRRVE